MIAAKPGGLAGLADVDRGIISREIFVSEEIYRQELERVFARAWLLLGHESQIPHPGDFFVTLLKRDRRGFHSVRINDQWRIIFNWKDDGVTGVAVTNYH